MKRLLVTGSRTWSDRDAIVAALRDAAESLRTPEDKLVMLVHGGCPNGADAMADDIWRYWSGIHPDRFAPPEVHKADWSSHGRAAGPIRNAEMVAAGADVCVAFIRNGSKGASGTVELAQTARIPVRVFREDLGMTAPSRRVDPTGHARTPEPALQALLAPVQAVLRGSPARLLTQQGGNDV